LQIKRRVFRSPRLQISRFAGLQICKKPQLPHIVKNPTEVPEPAADDPDFICFRKIPGKFWDFAGEKIKF
jgi:hypothetical protein